MYILLGNTLPEVVFKTAKINIFYFIKLDLKTMCRVKGVTPSYKPTKKYYFTLRVFSDLLDIIASFNTQLLFSSTKTLFLLISFTAESSCF